MLARNGSHWLIAPVLGLSILLFALFLGGVTGIGWFVPAGLVLSLPLLFVFSALSWNQSQASLARFCFSIQFVLFLLLGAVFGITGVSLNGAWQVLVFLGGVLGCWMALDRFRNSWLLASVCFLVSYHVIALISLLFAPAVEWKAVAYQFVSNFKIFALFGFLFFWSRWVGVEGAIRTSGVVIALFSVVALAVQWGVPEFYSKVFPNFWLLKEDTFFLPSSGMGVFHHPSILAGLAAALGAYFFSSFLKTRSWSDALLLLVLSILVLVSNQRQETVAYAFALSLLYLLSSRSTLFVRVSLVSIAGVLVAAGLSLYFWDSILRELTKWGVGTWERSSIPRYQLYDGALFFAEKYFPLGRGLGSYGGVGAMKFDLVAYYELGLNSQWWWPRYSHYLLDAYWPNSIGEGGYVGALFLVLHYLCLFSYFLVRAVSSASDAEKRSWVVAASAFLWILGTTPTSPGFQEILILFFPAALWVIAERKSDGR